MCQAGWHHLVLVCLAMAGVNPLLYRTFPYGTLCDLGSFGQHGLYRQHPGTDAVLQAMTGFAFRASGTGEPIPARVSLVVLLSGAYANQAVLAAILLQA